ncbi:MAG TPA: bifunctional diaminohydroxyphosphoribosylaminopyrimidine deaminase/5-amino-6-(5-phosphoribosylamino)uracil reductase RibD [Verrucomicrobiales bacterium]|nr:bifunctional diaminohydroxyphosphoribosylaminopyrimidine deaminase/5-amino-6-(5-phosphoribosylamino)uracil reductase RibD [Verrucomicrobiales bacterium]
MRRALSLARRGLGSASPNPLVGAVLVKKGKIIGEGWHRRAGEPHAEIEALRDAAQRRQSPRGATLFVSLEPCCTHGRTPPCTDAIIAAGIREVVVAATDPNPRHAGRGFAVLRDAGIIVRPGLLGDDATRLNAAFNHWIVHRTPLITLKAALTLDGKIATASGESRWITGELARRYAMRLRLEHDAVLIGVNTALADDPQLTIRIGRRVRCPQRWVLDTHARIPLTSRMLNDEFRDRTVIVVGKGAPTRRVADLRSRVEVVVAPVKGGRTDLGWLVKKLGQRSVTSLLVEGGGEVHASLLELGLAQRVAFVYGPLVLGGISARRGVGGQGFNSLKTAPRLTNVEFRRCGADLLLRGDL